VSQKPVLGKGLASLLPAAGAITAGEPTTVQQQEIGNKDRHPGISMAPIEEIITNHYQPRRDFKNDSIEELAQSIRSNGIIQPLVVRKGYPNGYQLIAGERRLRAAKQVGLKQVPVVIRKASDREILELALIENIQREDLNCIDEAHAYQQLHQEFSLSHEEVGERVGKNRTTIVNSLRLLKLPHSIIDDLKKGVLSFGHGKALLGLENKDACLKVRAKILEEKLSVRATEALVDALKQEALSKPTTQNLNTEPPLNSL
jgi:ParB family transcriptional regulator, chromosome partitioning protein